MSADPLTHHIVKSLGHSRDDILDAIRRTVDGLQPGQSIRITAHDPDEELDGRLFTVELPHRARQALE